MNAIVSRPLAQHFRAEPKLSRGFDPGEALWLPLRLAWRQLRAEKARLASAIAGVMFASVLVFMQLGFRAALFDSATALLASMRADIFLMQPMTTASFRPETMPRARASQALALPEVQAAVPIYMAQSSWRNPETGTRRSMQMIGFDTESGVMGFPGLAPLIETLKQPDTLAFDRRSRPEFGDVAGLLKANGPFEVQLGNRMMRIVGLVEIGPSFGADGNVVMSEVNFRRVAKERGLTTVDLVAIRLTPGADRDAAIARLREVLPADVMVLSQPQLVAHERGYWENATPIGFIFAFGSLMGLIVGMVIVYQILFSDIASYLKEYATLKAMGYSNAYLGRTVLSAALLLAIFGFVPGLALSTFLYDVVGKATFLPLEMEVGRAAGVFALIFTMCAAAGLLAMRKLRDANPADVLMDADPIVVRGLSYAFGTGDMARPVLRDIDLTLKPGEIVLLTGPSGSGKTTLLTLIGALRAMQTGQCSVLGQELANANEAARVALRRRIGFIFQSHNLLGFLTARQNVAMALELRPDTSERERLDHATDMLDAVGLGDRGDDFPARMSGGQRQRVAVARALVGDPGLILADEPTAALDRQSGGEVVRLLRDLAKRRGVPILLVTHDPRILDVADRIVAMEDGRIVSHAAASA